MINLEEILKEQGRSKTWLAKQMEVSRTTITNWSKGYNSPTIPTLKKLSKVLNIDISEFFKEAI